RAQEMAELIRRYGGEPILAPSMREVALSENRAALDFLPELEAGNFDIVVLTTGVGARALNEALLTRYPQERIVAAWRKARLVARGPKPAAVLKELGLAPWLSVPEPNTWREVLAALDGAAAIAGKRGAEVKSVAIYRWALPENLAPLRAVIQRIIGGDADAALFTNGAQAEHLFR